jgi:hypothetical protein
MNHSVPGVARKYSHRRMSAPRPPGHRCLQAALVCTCMECQLRVLATASSANCCCLRVCLCWRALARWLQSPQPPRLLRPPSQRALRLSSARRPRAPPWRRIASRRIASQRLDNDAVHGTRVEHCPFHHALRCRRGQRRLLCRGRPRRVQARARRIQNTSAWPW